MFLTLVKTKLACTLNVYLSLSSLFLFFSFVQLWVPSWKFIETFNLRESNLKTVFWRLHFFFLFFTRKCTISLERERMWHFLVLVTEFKLRIKETAVNSHSFMYRNISLQRFKCVFSKTVGSQHLPSERYEHRQWELFFLLHRPGTKTLDRTSFNPH